MTDTNYTIILTETENNALAYVALDQQDWIENAVHNRCRIAIDEIVQIAVTKYLELGESIPGSKEEIVAQAFARGWVKTAAERQAEYDQSILTATEQPTL
jgi:hypothetical protein